MSIDRTITNIVTAVAPRPDATRVIAVGDAGRTLLKARLRRDPQHWKALPTLLEALAFWQGTPVRAAFVASGDVLPGDTPLFGEAFDIGDRTPLYSVDLVWDCRSRGRQSHRRARGSFRELRELLVDELDR